MAITPKSYKDIMASLTDALSVTTAQQLQSGSVLQVESLEATLLQATYFDMKTLVPWPYMKYPQEYQKLLHFLAKLDVKIR